MDRHEQGVVEVVGIAFGTLDVYVSVGIDTARP
jgi:hypothetical protein